MYCSRLSIVAACAEISHLTTSPIESIPVILPSSITGRCRTRFSVMTRMQSTTVSPGLAVTSCWVIISWTRVSFEDFPLRMTFPRVVAFRNDSDQFVILHHRQCPDILISHQSDRIEDHRSGRYRPNGRNLLRQDPADCASDFHTQSLPCRT